VVRISTGNGAGYGPAAERAPAAIEADLLNRYVTPDEAREIYGYEG
jgi:N-methylhydantoinase B/oxoprolinase/acetone carboxylase alpha subunit